MMNGGLDAGLALGVDALVGDPRWWPHPVTLMGSAIGAYDHRVYNATLSPTRLRVRGSLLALGVPIAAFSATWAIVWAFGRIGVPFAWIAAIWFTSTTIAWKGLWEAGAAVYRALGESLPAAREAVGQIVGRDTDQLSELEVIRATIETLAENIVDGIVAPIFYAVIGGAPLAMAYRAVNTADSMVGYRNTRYRDFGWASAKLDDFMNYVPARLTAGLMWLVMAILGLAAGHAWRTMRHDAKKHLSPNAGIPESMMAGGLGIRLGGLNYYAGVPSPRAPMGDGERPLKMEDIMTAIRIIRWTGALAGLLVLAVGILPS